MVSWFEDRFFSHPSCKLIKNPLFLEIAWTTPFNPSSSFLNYLPLPPPLTRRFYPWQLSPPQSCSPCPSIFALWEGDLDKKQLILRWSWWLRCFVGRSVMSVWLPECVLCVLRNTKLEKQKQSNKIFTPYLRTINPFAKSLEGPSTNSDLWLYFWYLYHIIISRWLYITTWSWDYFSLIR